MFTGIVEEVGVITQKKISPDGANITIKAKNIFNDLKVNDSISCSGICLTVINVDQDEFKVQLVEETLNRTNAKNWDKGTCINLERSLLPSTRLGGHFVQGHIDDVVRITDIIPNKDSATWQFSIPKDLNEYIVQKGSICLDGISLTVADKNENYFRRPQTYYDRTFSIFRIHPRGNTFRSEKHSSFSSKELNVQRYFLSFLNTYA